MSSDLPVFIKEFQESAGLETQEHSCHFRKLCFSFRKYAIWGTWVAQWIKRPTLGLGSGHDLRVLRSAPGGAPGPACNLPETLFFSLCPFPHPSNK